MDIRVNEPIRIAMCACNYTWGADGQSARRLCDQHAAQCTCVRVWNGINQPPPCPVHGAVQSMTVTC